MRRRWEVGLALSLLLTSGLGCARSEVGASIADEQNDVAAGDAAAGGANLDDAGPGSFEPDSVATVDGGSQEAALPKPDAAAIGQDASAAGPAQGADAAADTTPATPPTPNAEGSFVDLTIADGVPFDRNQGDAHPSAGFAPPMGWKWYRIEGAKCRDGSAYGVFVHWGEATDKLFIYFEGGGACANPGFCQLNPVNVSQQFLTGGESALASLFIVPQPQAPNGFGVFDLQNPANPFKGWSQIYLPYCTGDVYSGTKTNVTIEGIAEKQNFYGADNTKRTIARIAATFKKDVKRFVAGGSSAGGYGAGINFGALQDTLKGAYGSALLDASPPFSNEYIPVCLQKRWRDTWGIDGNYPSDCGTECRSADGGNLFQIVDYWRRKYPKTNVALISGIHDEIIRLFFSLGNDECRSYNVDPPSLFIGTLGQTYPPEKFKAGLDQLRAKYASSNQLATYYMAGFPNATAHQCLFRARLYEKAAGADKPTIAEFLSKWLAGELTQVGP